MLRRRHQQAAGRRPRRPPARDQGSPWPEGARLMHLPAVEDEPTLNLQIARSLRAEGYVVDVAVNGRDRAATAKRGKLDAAKP